ncbi:MAG: agmatine deiminase family protein [Saprospiraceae bacterium]|nr:agmatine deiminase family protein [Saprospiraceae bacterium]
MQEKSLVRLPAEWELQSAIQFTWPHEGMDWGRDIEAVEDSIFQCISFITEDQAVIVTGPDKERIQGKLATIPPDRLYIVQVNSNDVWARDHGPITVESKGKYLLLDYQFNGWGGKYPAELDNQVTKHLAMTGLFHPNERHELSLVLEGGSIESDGQGTIIGSIDCLIDEGRNPNEVGKQILYLIKRQLGAHRILTLPSGHLAGDDTDGHIDTIARFCRPDTIAFVECDDPKDEHYDLLNDFKTELRRWKTLEGQPYSLIPLPLPDPCLHPTDDHRLPATYANFIISNKYVIVPTYGQAKDQIAIDILAKVFRQRKVVGVNALPIIKQHGSLHCLCMQYPNGVLSKII